MDTKETSYSQMVTVTRLNYRSDCNFTAGTIVGVLEDNTPVKVADDFYEFHHGHYWRKIKLGLSTEDFQPKKATKVDELEAQVLYTALMTDTLIEESDDNV